MTGEACEEGTPGGALKRQLTATVGGPGQACGLFLHTHQAKKGFDISKGL